MGSAQRTGVNVMYVCREHRLLCVSKGFREPGMGAIAAVLFFIGGIAINRYGFGKHFFFGERKMVRLCLWFMLENVWGYVTGFTTKVHRALMKRVLQEVIRERCKEFMRKRLEKESGTV